ncbi:hypothetical protein GN244_ATG07795 [Phytophthora infestans]|nr:hypothetical protein GN244_ATG07795 [Phytophthora infestans]
MSMRTSRWARPNGEEEGGGKAQRDTLPGWKLMRYADCGTGAPPPLVVALTPRPTNKIPTGNDVSLAAKTVVRTEKKTPSAKKVKPKDDDYVPDDDEEDEHDEDEWEYKPMGPSKTAKRKAEAKPNATAKPTIKSRKPSAAQIARVKAREARKAATGQRCVAGK